MNTIAIFGATGYIGRHLVPELARAKETRVKVLVRQGGGISSSMWSDNVEVIQGDLHDAETLRMFLEPGCTVVNLVYLWQGGESENLTVIRKLLEACRTVGIKRLIHCSTAAVVGRVEDNRITENTRCRPITEYGITKFKIEQEIISATFGLFDAAILRPTAVFGPGGEPLKKLANDLIHGARLRNYLKACLFGGRRMNLVHIANVVAATCFLIRRGEPIEGEVFIVSDDDKPTNNFGDVERYLMRSFHCPDYCLPRIPLPLAVLSLFLRCMGRNNVNPRCNYAQDKLHSLGFNPPVSFDDGLAEYAAWYRSTCMSGIAGAVH